LHDKRPAGLWSRVCSTPGPAWLTGLGAREQAAWGETFGRPSYLEVITTKNAAPESGSRCRSAREGRNGAQSAIGGCNLALGLSPGTLARARRGRCWPHRGDMVCRLCRVALIRIQQAKPTLGLIIERMSQPACQSESLQKAPIGWG
jgi:hypothetical protein